MSRGFPAAGTSASTSNEQDLDALELDNVAEARSATMETLAGGLSPDQEQVQLQRWAEVLRLVAPDFLADDCAVVETM